MKSIVTSDWLKDNISDPNLIIFDVSSIKNVSGLKTQFENIYIPGTRKLNLKDFNDKDNPIPNTLLNPHKFELAARRLGINKDSKIVVYDNIGIYTSPRAWWMFKVMGHDDVAVLDGGIQDWVENDFPCVNQPANAAKKGDFVADFQPLQYREFEDVFKNISNREELVIDARSQERFIGDAPEPRPNLKSGHIPESINIHYASVLKNGRMKTKNELKEIFANVGEKPLVFTCGSGTTACILMLAAQQILDSPMAIYDGSWSEWGSREDSKIELG